MRVSELGRGGGSWRGECSEGPLEGETTERDRDGSAWGQMARVPQCLVPRMGHGPLFPHEGHNKEEGTLTKVEKYQSGRRKNLNLRADEELNKPVTRRATECWEHNDRAGMAKPCRRPSPRLWTHAPWILAGVASGHPAVSSRAGATTRGP